MILKLGLFNIILIFVLSSCAPEINYINAVNDGVITYPGYNQQLNILTYNIKAIGEKDEDQTGRLISYINSQEYDFVVFQELFNETSREEILKGIEKDKYQSIVSRIDYDTFPHNLYQDAGLFLMSKYPQINLSDIDFGDAVKHTDGAIHKMLKKEISISQDFLSNKSVVGALYQINDSTKLFFFAAHLQALGSRTHKRIQLNQIRKFISMAVDKTVKAGVINDPQNLAILLAGDFNIDAYDEEDFTWLRKNLGNPRDFHMEFNKEKVEYSMQFKLFNFYKRFDYIFGYDEINKIALKQIKVKSINTTDITDSDEESISDHLAIKASIVIE